jgi:hypothetical protein
MTRMATLPAAWCPTALGVPRGTLGRGGASKPLRLLVCQEQAQLQGRQLGRRAQRGGGREGFGDVAAVESSAEAHKGRAPGRSRTNVRIRGSGDVRTEPRPAVLVATTPMDRGGCSRNAAFSVGERKQVVVEFRDPTGRRFTDHEIQVSEDGRIQPIIRDRHQWRFSHTSIHTDNAGKPIGPTIYVFTTARP